MYRTRRLSCAILTAVVLALGFSVAVRGQIGRSQGLLNPDLASEKELLALPHMNAAIVKGILERRPFLAMTDFNAFLSPSLNKEQVETLYGKMFVQINLNTAPTTRS